jgi:hypothetical protein
MESAKCKKQSDNERDANHTSGLRLDARQVSFCILHLALCTLHSCTLATAAEPSAAQVIGGDLSELVTWGSLAEPRRGPLVLLADGGLLVADVLGSDDERLSVDSALLGKLAIGLEELVGIVFHPPLDAARRDALIGRLRAGDARQDVLILDNGDEVSGTVQSIAPKEIELKTAAGNVKLETDRVVALAFDPALIASPRMKGLRTILGLSDGSRLVATKLVASAGKAQLALTGGKQAETPADQIVFLQPLGGKVEYLSDLKPAGYKHVPFLELPRDYRLDGNAAGGSLRSGGRLYLKGIGMHSASRLTFALDGRHKRFAAEAAIDDQAGLRGSVVFRVFVDAEQKYASPIIRGGDLPLPISVELPPDARSLSLIVDFAERGDELDYANWLNARLEE